MTALTAPTEGARPAAARCAVPVGAKVVRSSTEAVVSVRERVVGDQLGRGYIARTAVGCLRGDGRRTTLYDGRGSLGTAQPGHQVEIAGHMVAFVVTEGNRYEQAEQLTVVDLATGVRRTTETIIGDAGQGFTEVAVDRRGDAAWIRLVPVPKGTSWRLFPWRDDKVSLRYRSQLELSALTLDARTLRWREHGRLRSRPLAGY